MRIALLALLLPTLAQAFCGFYVGTADTKLVNTTTQVVMMRAGKTTVLSIQNDYKGPLKDFAMVVPVPVVLKAIQVNTLSADIFARIEKLSAPRLVEYWEEDPCAPMKPTARAGAFGSGGGLFAGATRMGGSGGVRVEAQFAVGEYEIVILSASQASGLESWLRDNGYHIPANADKLLRPYVRRGMKFFVAKVAVERVKFKAGRALLSPLRMAYESKDLRLPIRLGLINSSGTQDLLISILAKRRYKAANLPNVTIPTNLDIDESMRSRFGEFYAALFDATVAKHPDAVVTEYVWQTSQCDPCTGPMFNGSDLTTLGAALVTPATGRKHPIPVLTEPEVEGALDPVLIQRILRRQHNYFRYCIEKVHVANRITKPAHGQLTFGITPYGRVSYAKMESELNPRIDACVTQAVKRLKFPQSKNKKKVTVHQSFDVQLKPTLSSGLSMVLTRLHYRYTPGQLTEDLVFAPAKAIAGGREVRDRDGMLETGSHPTGRVNTFQARYAIRHPWQGQVQCKTPRFGRWDGPQGKQPAQPALDLSQVKRDAVQLKIAVPQGIPELGIRP